MLAESRGVIDDYVAELGLEPVEDPSNQDEALRRNVLRQSVLPVLEAEFPGAAAALARYGRLAAADDGFLDGLTRGVLGELIEVDGALDAVRLMEQPLALQRRVVQRWVMLRTTVEALSADRTEAVLALAEGTPGWPGG